MQNELTVYGYARLSTAGRSVDAQMGQLRTVGAGKVFREVGSRRRDRDSAFREAALRRFPP
jgi:hypothetical protein